MVIFGKKWNWKEKLKLKPKVKPLELKGIFSETTYGCVITYKISSL